MLRNMKKCPRCFSSDVIVRGKFLTCNNCCNVLEIAEQQKNDSKYVIPTTVNAIVEVFIDGRINRDAAIQGRIVSVSPDNMKIKVSFENYYTDQACVMTFQLKKRSNRYKASKGKYILGPVGSGMHGWGPKDA